MFLNFAQNEPHSPIKLFLEKSVRLKKYLLKKTYLKKRGTRQGIELKFQHYTLNITIRTHLQVEKRVKFVLFE